MQSAAYGKIAECSPLFHRGIVRSRPPSLGVLLPADFQWKEISVLGIPTGYDMRSLLSLSVSCFIFSNADAIPPSRTDNSATVRLTVMSRAPDLVLLSMAADPVFVPCQGRSDLTAMTEGGQGRLSRIRTATSCCGQA
jgi:hypothetical protein